MKVTFEGSEAEITKIVLAAFSTDKNIIAELPDNESSEESEVAADIVAANQLLESSSGLETTSSTSTNNAVAIDKPIQGVSIRARVLDIVIKYPGMIISEISAALGLTTRQVEPAVRFLMKRKDIAATMKPGTSQPISPLRVVAKRAATAKLAAMANNGRAPRHGARSGKRGKRITTTSLLIDYLAKNPSSTAVEAARALQMRPGNISAALTNMTYRGQVSPEGLGGVGSPYRYSLAQ